MNQCVCRSQSTNSRVSWIQNLYLENESVCSGKIILYITEVVNANCLFFHIFKKGKSTREEWKVIKTAWLTSNTRTKLFVHAYGERKEWKREGIERDKYLMDQNSSHYKQTFYNGVWNGLIENFPTNDMVASMMRVLRVGRRILL